jgi:EAL domain-containing protein (putative c-di-GMP-specific phosphodiesterase class I)
VKEREVRVTASIGICTYPDDGADAATLLKNADLAMYRAKEQGKNTFQYYSAQMTSHSVERLALESGLRRAMDSGQLLLYYQPAFEVASGRLSGAEALVRWQHPERGLVSPTSFIALAEESDLIEEVGKWVLKAACSQLRAWRDQGLAVPRVSINISPRQFARSDLPRAIERQTRDTGLDPRALEIEVTEGTVMREPERMAGILAQIKAMGVSVAIDDFGTGYSSLAYLKRFPIDRLKIDRSFISGLPEDAEDIAITRSIIAMAHGLRLKVLAEGVETAAQLEFLREHGCDEMQGFLRGKPMPVDEFTALLQENNASSTAGAGGERVVVRSPEKGP